MRHIHAAGKNPLTARQYDAVDLLAGLLHRNAQRLAHRAVQRIDRRTRQTDFAKTAMV